MTKTQLSRIRSLYRILCAQLIATRALYGIGYPLAFLAAIKGGGYKPVSLKQFLLNRPEADYKTTIKELGEYFARLTMNVPMWNNVDGTLHLVSEYIKTLERPEIEQILCWFFGIGEEALTEKQIAQRLGCRIGTVKYKIYLGMRLLRKPERALKYSWLWKTDNAFTRLSGIETNPWRELEELELSIRTFNCLRNANLTTTQLICTKTPMQLMRDAKMGRKSLNELIDVLETRGLSLTKEATRES